MSISISEWYCLARNHTEDERMFHASVVVFAARDRQGKAVISMEGCVTASGSS